jgi:hypothetical protein
MAHSHEASMVVSIVNTSFRLIGIGSDPRVCRLDVARKYSYRCINRFGISSYIGRMKYTRRHCGPLSDSDNPGHLGALATGPSGSVVISLGAVPSPTTHIRGTETNTHFG